MTDRWQQIEKIYHSALELEESQRVAFLEEACAGDEALRQEVESLLRSEQSGDRFIEEPALEMAAKMFVQAEPQSLLGQQVGSYQIQSLLGTGGMGVVYKARDTRLKRSVAIKVLPADQVSDPERKRRFIQEARAASALNHPNIITIYDIGSEHGIDFVVMEYVAGKTLGQLIPRKGLRLNETLKLAVQMADALATAHSAGIIHRDLKPGNLMVTEAGLVKVLDFGLAKLTEVSESGEGTTHTLEPQTETGTIMGTVSYMSPEQAEGKKVDARSDIFSFGAVLYEMVTGQKAFQEDSRISTLAAVLNKNPKPAIEINPAAPRELDRIINHCLRKDAGRRFQDMDDLKVELEDLKEDSDSGASAGTPPVVRPARWSWIWAGTAVVVVAMAITGWLFRGSARQRAAALHVIPLTTFAGSENSPSFSPDGNQVAFSWNGEKQNNFDIYIKLIGSSAPVRLTTDPAEDLSPAFSPDGRSIGFVRTSKGQATFIVIPAIGGSERIVADLPESVRSFSWFPDGKWVVTDGLALLSTESGEARSLTSPQTKSSTDFDPAVSPDGLTIVFSRFRGGVSDIYLLDLTDDLKPKGEPKRLTSLKGSISGSAWTRNGREIIFSSGTPGAFSGLNLWKVQASGAAEPEQLPFNAGEACFPTISRNGNRLAYQRVDRDLNIWRLPLSAPGVANGPPSQLIASTRWEEAAQYSPNGKRIAFESNRSGIQGIWVSDADGTKVSELYSRAGSSCGTPNWSPDGQLIAFDFTSEGNNGIYVIRATGGKITRLTTTSDWDWTPTWSRDGKWVYFASNRTGRWETWKVLATGGQPTPVTRNGGGMAFESPDGKAIYYIKGSWSGGLWKIPLDGRDEKQVLPSVHFRALSVMKDGIYFIPEPGGDGKYFLQLLSFATDRVKTVIPIRGRASEELSVSPDGRSILFSQVDEAGSDLMLVENFQ